MRLWCALLGFAAWLPGLVMADTEAVRAALREALPGVTVTAVEQSKVPGLFEVVVGPNLFYATADGHYLFQGSVLDTKTKENLTENKLADLRIAEVDKVGEENMIIFAPTAPQKVVHTVTVFTDIDCGYCRKLHSQINGYLGKGIRVRYLFLPRAGVRSESFDKAVAVWCSKDRKAALTQAKQGENIGTVRCANPIQEHMRLASELGARGTPFMVTDAGQVLPGYFSPDQLSQLLDHPDRTAFAE